MNPLNERNFHTKKDSSFKITAILERSKLINALVQALFNLIFKAVRTFLTKKNEDSGELVIFNFHRLGDTVFTIPALSGIYKCYENYNITILCFPESESILKIKFKDANIITVDKNNFSLQRKFAKPEIRKLVNKLNAEIIFDITGDPASASLLLNSSAKKIIGINLPYFKKLYTTFVPIRKKPHYMDIYLDVLKAAKPGFNDYSYDFSSSFSAEGKILVHPFAIRKSKEWNLYKYIELSKRLSKNYNVSIVSPPHFIDDDVLEEIKSSGLNYKITNSIDELIETTKDASLFISNDSGPVYIASLLGKPTFAVYGPTNPKYSLPFGKNHKYFRKTLSCSPIDERVCFTLGGIYCPSYECLNSISVDEVELAVKEFIGEVGIEEKETSVDINKINN